MIRKRFSWDPDGGTAACELVYKGRIFKGEAHCHFDDYDFQSERTGCFIAECRAELAMLKYRKNCELKPALQALKHTYGLLVQSSKYNPDSHESKTLYKQIQLTNFDLITVSNEITTLTQNLKTYIDGKEKLYQRLRKAKNNKSE